MTAPVSESGGSPCAGVPRLDSQLCFALYVCSKELIRSYKPFLDPCGLTYTGYITMLALWEKDDLSVKDLGQRLTLDSGTLTPLLKKLEAQGYVCRTRGRSDQRTVMVRVTPRGQRLRRKAAQIPSRLFASTNIDPKNTAVLTDCLHRLSAHLFKNRLEEP